jgi:uncharacterized OsmC-like protein
MVMPDQDRREYRARASSTNIFGRVLCSVRNHHTVIDGPEQNGCPGEEVNPAELFLAAVAACGVELVEVIAKSANMPLRAIQANIEGIVDRSRPVRSDISLFNSVRLQFTMEGVTDPQARQLVETFKGR